MKLVKKNLCFDYLRFLKSFFSDLASINYPSKFFLCGYLILSIVTEGLMDINNPAVFTQEEYFVYCLSIHARYRVKVEKMSPILSENEHTYLT